MVFKLKVIVLALLLLPCVANALRDPTRPLGYEKKAVEESYRLQSVLIGGNRKLAVINGERLKEEQTISHSNGVKVIKIEPYRVLLQRGEKRWALILRDSGSMKNTAEKK